MAEDYAIAGLYSRPAEVKGIILIAVLYRHVLFSFVLASGLEL